MLDDGKTPTLNRSRATARPATAAAILTNKKIKKIRIQITIDEENLLRLETAVTVGRADGRRNLDRSMIINELIAKSCATRGRAATAFRAISYLPADEADAPIERVDDAA